MTKDDEIKKKQRAVLSNVQKQRDELQQKVDEYEKERKQLKSNTAILTISTAAVVAVEPEAEPPAPELRGRAVQTDAIETENTYTQTTDNVSDEVAALQSELDELRDRNETLEDYYEVNSKQTNETHKLAGENQKLTSQVKSLREQVQSHQYKNKGIASELATYKQMYAVAVATQQQPIRSEDGERGTCEHLCYTAGGCMEKTQQQNLHGLSLIHI